MKRIATILGLAFALAACSGGAGSPAPSAGGSASAGTSATPSPSPVPGNSTPASIKEKGKLVCGVKFDVKGFGFRNPTNSQVEGFDADLCREIAKKIGVEVELIEAVSANRIPFLNERRVDLIASTFTVNEDRKKQIDFSDVYFKTGQRILVKKDNTTIKEVADLGGKTVCAQRGSTSELNITTAQPAARPLLLDSYPACLLALQQGQADAVSTDETILFGLVGQDKNTMIVGKPFSTELYGIGVKKSAAGDRTGFTDFISRTLVGMITNGSWAKIYEQYITPVSNDKKATPDS